ncbi:unnamed protein product [Victoria cruziana]
MEIEVREVWGWNLKEEMESIASIKDFFPFVALDTEFPGFIAPWSSRQATADELAVQPLRLQSLLRPSFPFGGRVSGGERHRF